MDAAVERVDDDLPLDAVLAERVRVGELLLDGVVGAE